MGGCWSHFGASKQWGPVKLIKDNVVEEYLLLWKDGYDLVSGKSGYKGEYTIWFYFLKNKTMQLRDLYQKNKYQTDWFKIEKGACQGCLLSPCLFNLYTEHIMRNARLDELQAGLKIGGRNISNFR